MARYIGPVCRLCRREAMKLFLKGERCYTEKCAIEKRNYAPGQHGKGGRIKSKLQGYGLQLREKQKTKRLYGMMEGQFALTFTRASQEKGVVGETLLLVEARMTREGIRVDAALDPTLPPLLADAGALQQVTLNLLTNAQEAMAASGEIRIETRSAPGRPGWIQLLVADTGSGIAPELLSRIFDPFYTTKPKGTGLGLSLSYGIVQDHQGTIDVQSDLGKGTTFTLTFPGFSGETGDPPDRASDPVVRRRGPGAT